MTHQSVSRRVFVACGAIASLPSAVNSQEVGNKPVSEWLKPTGLKRGDTIALVAPAGPADRELALSYKKRLESDGSMQEKLRDG